jgi:hypothetical protein
MGIAAVDPSPAPLGVAGGNCGGMPLGFIVASAMIHSLFSHLLVCLLGHLLDYTGIFKISS